MQSIMVIRQIVYNNSKLGRFDLVPFIDEDALRRFGGFCLSYSSEHWSEKCPLLSIGDQAKGQACAEPGSRTPSAPAKILRYTNKRVLRLSELAVAVCLSAREKYNIENRVYRTKTLLAFCLSLKKEFNTFHCLKYTKYLSTF